MKGLRMKHSNKLLETITPAHTFCNPSLGRIRVIDRNGTPWFVAQDIRKILDMKRPRSATSKLDRAKKHIEFLSTPGGTRPLLVVSRDGLLLITARERKPQAAALQGWISDEVLPALQKLGMSPYLEVNGARITSRSQLKSGDGKRPGDRPQVATHSKRADSVKKLSTERCKKNRYHTDAPRHEQLYFPIDL